MYKAPDLGHLSMEGASLAVVFGGGSPSEGTTLFKLYASDDG